MNTLSTLAPSSLVKSTPDDVAEDRIFVVSIDVTPMVEGFTVGEGPIEVGVAHSDYTAAEIEEWVENETSMFGELDQIAIEIRRRKIRSIGVFDGLTIVEKMNEGVPVRVKLLWPLSEGAGLSFWAYNRGIQLTTGASVQTQGKVYWRKA